MKYGKSQYSFFRRYYIKIVKVALFKKKKTKIITFRYNLSKRKISLSGDVELNPGPVVLILG